MTPPISKDILQLSELDLNRENIQFRENFLLLWNSRLLSSTLHRLDERKIVMLLSMGMIFNGVLQVNVSRSVGKIN
ncbi:hypothetical protein SUGI_0694420 [Cryptomeria japonica]|nr:hypothetical protein SUGI_0694420 [Cryptomeria japonica]